MVTLFEKDINTNFGLLPASFAGYQIVKEGYIILRLTDLQNDKKSLRVGLVKEKGIITSAYLGLIFNKKLYPAFCYYLLHCYDLKKVFYWEGGSVRQSMKFEDFKTVPLIIPSIEEQVAISKFLEKKSATIDLIVGNIKKQIELLKELRKSLINDVVTGKNKNNELTVMKELDLQDKYIINFLTERPDGLRYKEVKANTVSAQFFAVEDLKHFISSTTLNKDNYKKLLRKFSSEKELLDKFMEFLNQRIKEAMNMAIFINSNKSVTFEGVKLHLFYPSGSETHEDKLFDENIFFRSSGIAVHFQARRQTDIFLFRPDFCLFSQWNLFRVQRT